MLIFSEKRLFQGDLKEDTLTQNVDMLNDFLKKSQKRNFTRNVNIYYNLFILFDLTYKGGVRSC